MRSFIEKNNETSPLALTMSDEALLERIKQALISQPKESKKQPEQPHYLSQLIELGRKQGYLIKAQIKEAMPADVEETFVRGILENMNITIFDNNPSPEELMLWTPEPDDAVDLSSVFTPLEEKFSDDMDEVFTTFLPSQQSLDVSLSSNLVDRSHRLLPNPEYSKQKLSEEILGLYNLLDDLLSKKTNQLKTNNKKLLIVLGEGHRSRKSLVIEYISLQLLNKYGIEHVVSETTEELLTTIRSQEIEHDSPNFSFFLPIAEKNGLKITAGELDNHQSDFQREKVFKQKIHDLNNHCMFLTGMNHLPAFITDKELSKQFELLIINAANLSEQEKARYKAQQPTAFFETILNLVTMPEVIVQANMNTPIDQIPAAQLFSIVDGILNKPALKEEAEVKFIIAPESSPKLEVLKKGGKDSVLTEKTQNQALSFDRPLAKNRTNRASHHFSSRNQPRFFELMDDFSFQRSRPLAFTNHTSFERPYFPTAIDFASEPKYYYHSIGAMNPMKLIGILKEGILSKHAAETRRLVIDANGIQCNGTHYVSTATHFCGCMNSGDGAFHFVIEREKLTTDIRKNPEQDMPTERQVYLSVPRQAIKAIQLEKEGFIDIEHPSIKLGIGCFEERATKQVAIYVNFMASEFGYNLPQEDLASIQNTIHEMKTASSMYKDFLKEQEATKRLEANIESVIKKHLKICFKKLIMKDVITPYDILRHYDQNIPVYDHNGKDINPPAQVSESDSESKPKPSLPKKRIASDALLLTSTPGLLFDPEKTAPNKSSTDLITKTKDWTKERGWSEKDTEKFASAISTIKDFNKQGISKILAQLEWMNPDDIAEEYFNHINAAVTLKV